MACLLRLSVRYARAAYSLPPPEREDRQRANASCRGGGMCVATLSAHQSAPPRLDAAASRRPSPSGREKLAVLAPDAERFLGGTIGNAEQHGFTARAMRITLPRRDDENVAVRPFQRLAIELGRALALDA